MTIKPRQPAPPLEVKLLDGSTWRLGDAKPATFEMIVVYRGLHCPVCKTYLGDLESKLPEFSKRGVDVIAVSTDGRDRAEKAKAEWGLNNLRVGCELSIANARAWELFISRVDPRRRAAGVQRARLVFGSAGRDAVLRIARQRPLGPSANGSNATGHRCRDRTQDARPGRSLDRCF